MNIVPITIKQIPALWPSIETMVIESLEYTDYSFNEIDILVKLLQGQFVLLVAYHNNEIYGIQTLEILDNNKRICNLVTTAGHDSNQWQDKILEVVEMIAQEKGCDYIETAGRIGWFKQLKRNGFKPVYFVARKEVKKS